MTNTKDRIVYIGGFAGGNSARDRVGQAVDDLRFWNDVEPFTVSYARSHPLEVERATKDSSAILTHSAGALEAVKHASNQELHAIAPPLPRSKISLATSRTALKALRMMNGAISSRERFNQVMRYNRNALGELIRHPHANLSALGAISTFDITTDATEAPFTHVHAAFMSDDAFFRPNDAEFFNTSQSSIDPVFLMGEHDELLLSPDNTLKQYFTHINKKTTL